VTNAGEYLMARNACDISAQYVASAGTLRDHRGTARGGEHLGT
jgi:hypothetical protein